jgi:hypothetical protein
MAIPHLSLQIGNASFERGEVPCFRRNERLELD